MRLLGAPVSSGLWPDTALSSVPGLPWAPHGSAGRGPAVDTLRVPALYGAGILAVHASQAEDELNGWIWDVVKFSPETRLK